MKQHPKYSKRSILFTGTLALGLAALLATASAATHRRGTDILHFFVREAMTNVSTLSNAVGRVDVRQNQQGHANVQTLDVTTRGLDTNTTYQLVAVTLTNTTLTPVSTFNTDAKGRAALHYRKVITGNGNSAKLGRGKLALPVGLEPLSQVREVSIYDTNNQPVLLGDLGAPDQLNYLIKRDLSTNNVIASLQIIAHTRQTQFRLLASGLVATNDYLLALNGGVVQTNTTDAKGRLFIRSLMETPIEILDLRTVELWDSASNAVLSTTLP